MLLVPVALLIRVATVIIMVANMATALIKNILKVVPAFLLGSHVIVTIVVAAHH